MGSVGTNIRAAGWGTEGLAGSSKDLGFTLVTMDSFIPSPLCVCVCVCARARTRACARFPFIQFSKFLQSIFYAKKETSGLSLRTFS